MNILNSFTINKKKIQNYHKPFVIAEIGSNHDQDIEKAKYLINKSAECGADAVKIQIFKSYDFKRKFAVRSLPGPCFGKNCCSGKALFMLRECPCSIKGLQRKPARCIKS